MDLIPLYWAGSLAELADVLKMECGSRRETGKGGVRLSDRERDWTL